MRVELPRGARAAAPLPVDRDYATIQVVLNHLQIRDDGHEVCEFVMSTESQLESLASLASYYKLLPALSTPSTLAIVQAMVNEDAAILILTTRENTQVIIDLNDWAALSDHFPTQFAVVDFLSKTVATHYAQAMNEKGGIPTLMMFGLNLVDVPEVSPGVANEATSQSQEG